MCVSKNVLTWKFQNITGSLGDPASSLLSVQPPSHPVHAIPCNVPVGLWYCPDPLAGFSRTSQEQLWGRSLHVPVSAVSCWLGRRVVPLCCSASCALAVAQCCPAAPSPSSPPQLPRGTRICKAALSGDFGYLEMPSLRYPCSDQLCQRTGGKTRLETLYVSEGCTTWLHLH